MVNNSQKVQFSTCLRRQASSNNNFKFLIVIFTFSFLIINSKPASAKTATPSNAKITPVANEIIYQFPLAPIGTTSAPLVVNVEVKERGRVEHLADFAYNKLRDPVLTATLTSIFWIIIIAVFIKSFQTGPKKKFPKGK